MQTLRRRASGEVLVQQFVAAMRLPVSSERLEAYRPVGGTDARMLTEYLWNVALCEALYPSLNALEVSLRNSVHAAATRRYQTEYWFDRPGVLKLRQPDEVQTARKELARRGKRPTAGRIVAELRFGFWTALLSGPYHASFWMPEHAAILNAAFPHLPRRRRLRKDIHDRYNSLRFLRNRVVHHEPIHRRPTLLAEHGAILDAVGWISPEMVHVTRVLDRFRDVHRHGRGRIERQLKDELGIV